jgi:co-chaperonin GroES (HSP10)
MRKQQSNITNPKTISIPHNLVMVYPNADISELGGLTLADEYEGEHYQSIIGEVLQVPDKLLFYGKQIRELKATLQGIKAIGSFEQKLISNLTALSCEYDCDMELQIGDKVVFKHMHHTQGDYVEIGRERKAMLIPYHDLVMAYRNNSPIMLNGYLFVEPLELDEAERVLGGMYDTQEVLKGGHGKVIDVGSPNRAYRDYPNEVDLMDIQRGDIIFFRKSSGVVMEWDFLRELHHDTKHKAIRLQRKDILQIFK